MKYAVIGIIVCLLLPLTQADFASQFARYEKKMNDLINNQINVELQGHYTYLHLSHFFADKTRYYPKVSKYFRAKADEEMQHAERFIQYQNQRGGKFELTSVSLPTQALTVCDTLRGSKFDLRAAFKCAQALEIHVTQKLTELANQAGGALTLTSSDTEEAVLNDLLKGQSVVITSGNRQNALNSCFPSECSSQIDTVAYVELAEMITHEFLGHQLEDTKEIANYFNTLEKFGEESALGQYLFDKNL